MNKLFPVFLKLENLRVLLVGGGGVALEKLSALRKNCPQASVTLVAPAICDEIKSLHGAGLTLVERAYQTADLEVADIVLLATDDRLLHHKILAEAHERRLLVNVADTPDLCDFYLGSVVTRGDLKIGISTNGKSPTLSKRIREYLEEAIPGNIQETLDNLEAIRLKLKGDFQSKVKALNEATAVWLRKS